MSTIEIGAARETTAEFLLELAAGLAVVMLTIFGLAASIRRSWRKLRRSFAASISSNGERQRPWSLDELFPGAFAG